MIADGSENMPHVLKDTFEKLAVGFCVVQDGTFRFVNPRLAELCGYTLDEMIAARPEDLVFSDDLSALKQNLWSMIAGEMESVRCEFRIVTKSGRTRNVEASFARTLHDGQPAVAGTLVDITEHSTATAVRKHQRHTTEAISGRTADREMPEDSEKKYQSIFENATEGIFQTTPEGRCLAANPAFARMFGYGSAEEVMAEVTDIGRQLYADPGRREKIKRLLEEAGEIRGFEVEAIRKYGARICISINVHVVRDKAGAVRFYEGTFQDITDRKRVEESLLESEERYRTAIEHSNDGVVLIKGGRHIYVNRKYLDIHGYDSPDEILGKTLAATVHPDDLARVERINELRRRGKPSPECYELKGIRKDGSEVFIEISVTTITYRGEMVTLAYARDITDRKRAEEALRWKTALFEAQVNASIDGILVVDKEHRRIIINSRLVDMLGIPQAVLDDKEPEALIRFLMGRVNNPEEFLQRVRYLYGHPNESGRDEIELDNGMVFDRHSAPVLGDDGYYYGRIWAFRDITEVKRYWHILEDLSTTDGLTGISNRRRFDEFMGREWRSCMREGRQLSLLFIDIDYFKQFNDLYGHLAGDDCLRKIATVLQTTARRGNDMAARYGGEEFACVLPATGKKNALLLARKIIARTVALNIPHEGSSAAPYVTVSIGVATLVPGRGQHYSHLIDAADRSLYSAKLQGRNRVVALSDETDPLHVLLAR
jgi:diguanylate cyclase (GGDEF)-like protein/PAS domain S-box-containing protein